MTIIILIAVPIVFFLSGINSDTPPIPSPIPSPNSDDGNGSIPAAQEQTPQMAESEPEELTPALSADTFSAVSVGSGYVMAIDTDSKLWAWGNNEGSEGIIGGPLKGGGTLGDGTTINRSSPVYIMDNVAQVSAGYIHTVAVKADGSLWTWGSNDSGQLGDGTTTDSHTPVKIMDNASAAHAAGFITVAIKYDRTLWAWGSNTVNQLGDGTSTNRVTPVKIMDDVISASSSGVFTMALKTDGSLWAWGRYDAGWAGDFSMFGEGVEVDQSYPIKIMDDVSTMSAAGGIAAVIKTDGSLWTWGVNWSGWLGDGTRTDRSVPEKIMDDVIFVHTDYTRAFAIKTNGSLWAWGANEAGQLGDGTTTDQLTPVHIMDDIAYISSNSHNEYWEYESMYYVMVIKTDGSLWAWGGNDYGQIGDGTTIDRDTPIRITAGIPPD